MSGNLKSAYQYSDFASSQLNKEIIAHRILGPFLSPPIPNLRVSPIGVVPKKEPGQFRIIHHLSYPEGLSVNDFIDKNVASVNYTSFDQAVHIIQIMGKGCYLSKADIKSAFRLIPIRQEDFNLLGISFNDRFYIDTCLPFGCRVSCAIFENFAMFLQWATELAIGQGRVLHYLDDFLFVGNSS